MKHFFLLGLVALATPAFADDFVSLASCYTDLPPSVQAVAKVRASVTCANTGEPQFFVYGEEHANAFDDNLYAEYVGYHTAKKHLMCFREGLTYDSDAGVWNNGLDTGNISAITVLNILPKLYVMALMQRDVAHAEDFLWKTFTAFKSLRADWSRIPRPFADPNIEKYAQEVESKIFSESIGSADQLTRDPLLFNVQGLTTVTETLYKYAEMSLARDADFAGLSDADIAHYGITVLRELKWLKNIQSRVCQAGQANSPIWIQVGDQHRDDMLCALKKMYPNASFKSASTRDQKQTSARLIDGLNNSLPTVRAWLVESYATIGVHLSPSDIQIETPLDGTNLPPYMISISASGQSISEALWAGTVAPALKAKLKTLGYELGVKKSFPNMLYVQPKGPFSKF